MESELRIDAADGKVIYARFRDVPSAPIVVVLHGMTGHMNGRLELQLARRLETEGIGSLRYNAYDWPDDARDLCEMGLSEHLADLESVLHWVHTRRVPVAVVGHSFGGLCVLLRGSEDVAAAVVWDPAAQRVWSKMNRSAATHDAERQEYVQRSRVGVVFSERIMHEMDAADASEASKAFEAPLLVVGSPEWPHINAAGREYASLAPQAQWLEIENADHNFTDDVSEDLLMRTTVAWLAERLLH